MKTVNFPIKYKKDIVISEKWSFEKFYNFAIQYKIEPDVIVAEYECLMSKTVTKTQLNKVLTNKKQ